MIELSNIEHHIQKHIISVLIHQSFARFRDLRPPRTDTNLFSYHLKSLIRAGFIQKGVKGYTLSYKGLAYVDRVSLKRLNIRTQPKIITMVVLYNTKGEVLLQRRGKQPYIDTWTLPYGKLHIDDETVGSAARREVKEKLGMEVDELAHEGDCYIRIKTDDGILSNTLVHVFSSPYRDETLAKNVRWSSFDALDTLVLAPAVSAILGCVRRSSGYFFEEISEEWTVVTDSDQGL